MEDMLETQLMAMQLENFVNTMNQNLAVQLFATRKFEYSNQVNKLDLRN